MEMFARESFRIYEVRFEVPDEYLEEEDDFRGNGGRLEFFEGPMWTAEQAKDFEYNSYSGPGRYSDHVTVRFFTGTPEGKHEFAIFAPIEPGSTVEETLTKIIVGMFQAQREAAARSVA